MFGPALRPRSRRLLAVATFLTGLLVVGLGSTFSWAPAAAAAPACTCTRTGSVEVRAQGVTSVFTGQVSGYVTDAVGTGKGARQVRRYDVVVERVYQGSVNQPRVVVVSPAAAADCGLGRIPTGKTWLFFVNGGGTKFFGNTCQGTERATSALLRRVEGKLGSGEAVVEPEPEPAPLAYRDEDAGDPPPLSRLVAPGAAVTLLGLLGLALVGRARRRPAEDR